MLPEFQFFLNPDLHLQVINVKKLSSSKKIDTPCLKLFVNLLFVHRVEGVQRVDWGGGEGWSLWYFGTLLSDGRSYMAIRYLCDELSGQMKQ